jgi:transposase InsO family protein
MQVRGLPSHIIRNARAASRLVSAQPANSEAERRRDAVARWRAAMREGLSAQAAARAVGVPRSTLYRWREDAQPKSRKPLRVRQARRPPGLVVAVENMRLKNPFAGKYALGPLLRNQGWDVADSMIGRIVCDLIARGRVLRVSEMRSKSPAKPGPNKRPYARRKPKDLVFAAPGDVVQIDTMTIARPVGPPIKHFDAYDPFAKWTVARPCRRATAKNAAAFLDKVVAEMPYPVKVVQIDGGSEFMAEFEQACADKNIILYVLPPRSPKLNGAVERCNQTWRYEFYGCLDPPSSIEELAREVDRFQHRYNHFRPHGALDYKTPAQYLSTCRANKNPESHMS